MNFLSADKLPRTHWWIYEVPRNRSAERISTIQNLAKACKSSIYTCMVMMTCNEIACLVTVFNGGALTGLTYDCKFSGRNELLTSARPLPCTIECNGTLPSSSKSY